MSPLHLHSRLGDLTTDADLFDSFACWDGDPDKPWVEEVENYVRIHVLKDCPHTLAFFDEDEQLIAVSAFRPSQVLIPRLVGQSRPSWHLVVAAVSLEHQGRGCSAQVFDESFDTMRGLDGDRLLVTGYVHQDNLASLKACAKAGLDPFEPKGGGYIVVLGEVPAA